MSTVDAFLLNLGKLNPTQESIETLSHWMVFHRKCASALAQAWLKTFLDGRCTQAMEKSDFPAIKRKVAGDCSFCIWPTTYYRTAVKRAPNSCRTSRMHFIEHLPLYHSNMLQLVLEAPSDLPTRSSEDKLKKDSARIVAIWQERTVYDSAYCSQLLKVLDAPAEAEDVEMAVSKEDLIKELVEKAHKASNLISKLDPDADSVTAQLSASISDPKCKNVLLLKF